MISASQKKEEIFCQINYGYFCIASVTVRLFHNCLSLFFCIPKKISKAHSENTTKKDKKKWNKWKTTARSDVVRVCVCARVGDRHSTIKIAIQQHLLADIPLFDCNTVRLSELSIEESTVTPIASPRLSFSCALSPSFSPHVCMSGSPQNCDHYTWAGMPFHPSKQKNASDHSKSSLCFVYVRVYRMLSFARIVLRIR